MIKKILNSIVVPVVLSVLCGCVFGKMVYFIYNDNLKMELSSSKIYLIENGEYESYESMREENTLNSYVYYKDNNKYKSVVGITKNYDNVNKIKNLYNDDIKVEEYYVSDMVDMDKFNEYDIKLMEIDDVYEVKEIVDNILNLYRDSDKIKLISLQ